MTSKKYAVIEALDAQEDFTEAVRYYLGISGRQSAESLVARFEEVVEHLETLPFATPAIGDTAYRWMPVGAFVAVFSVDESARTVRILRILHGTSNWKNRLLQGGRP